MSSDADFTWKHKWVALVPKPFAFLSVLGSIYITQHVLRSSKRRQAVFHRILLGLSIYDTMTSLAVFMGTWMIPKGTSGVYLAGGNSATCATQGFFIQLGVGTPLYNTSLAFYYFLVIFKGWKEHQLQKVEPLFHLLPVTFSLASAIAAAAYSAYGNSNVWCWTTSDHNRLRFGLLYGPVWAAMAIVTIAMAAIYTRVYVQERKSNKWRMTGTSESNDASPSTTNNNTETGNSQGKKNRQSASSMIANQSLFYLGSFYLTWAFPSWTRISQMVNDSTPFVAISLFTIFFPLQG